jgi:DNA polymerase III delta prime subunit
MEAQATPDRSPRQAEWSQTQIDRAHRRFVEGIKAMAQVQRLLSPVVQVNIAKQQVNVAP